MSDNFSKGKRGAIILPDPKKVRITIRLDGDVVEYFKNKVLSAGGGNYQSLINEALRNHIETEDAPIEETIRKVIREELRHAS